MFESIRKWLKTGCKYYVVNNGQNLSEIESGSKVVENWRKMANNDQHLSKVDEKWSTIVTN
jgi:hypothetical protein